MLALFEVNSDPDCLKCAPEYARSDRFVVMEAVAKDGQALGYAVPELRADKEVVSRAVSQEQRLMLKEQVYRSKEKNRKRKESKRVLYTCDTKSLANGL